MVVHVVMIEVFVTVDDGLIENEEYEWYMLVVMDNRLSGNECCVGKLLIINHDNDSE